MEWHNSKLAYTLRSLIIFLYLYLYAKAMKKIIFISLFCTLLAPLALFSQNFSREDSLRGSVTKERAWWDLLHYSIEVDPDVPNKSISGMNTITYKVLEEYQTLQIDLQQPMKILDISQDGQKLSYTNEFGAYFVQMTKKQMPGDINQILIHFSGTPPESQKPPWDGGFVWKKDANNKDFVANANQGIGSSSWLPSKDHPYDEPDQGMEIKVMTPNELISVSNGRLVAVSNGPDQLKIFHWKVINPINGYGININMADYVHFNETYQGEKGDLDCDYYVLSYNLEKAKEQFKQVPKMLEAFEYWFGPYPFYEDGYKLVETPYLGMEHQSSVTYGNAYQNGYLGRDLSSTGYGLKFDFIIIHESGHEWFANNLTYNDVADMWIHESFTSYSEALYLDYHFGTEAGNAYCIGHRKKAANKSPIAGIHGVNKEGSGDMYMKGAGMIHTLRQIINDDEKFRSILRGLNTDFYHQTLSGEDVENYFMEKMGLDLHAFFDQYLRTTAIPVLQYKIKGGVLSYRFKKVVQGFSIPVKFHIDTEEVWLSPSEEWQTYALQQKNASVKIDENFYVIPEKR